MKILLFGCILVLFSAFLMSYSEIMAGNFIDLFSEKEDIRKKKDYEPEMIAENVPPLYGEACGECHFSYQADLLPQKSWQRMMEIEELEDHFGEYLEYEPEVMSAVETYLYENAGDISDTRLGRKIANSLDPNSPLVISKSRFFIRKHTPIDKKKMVEENMDVLSYANCTSCHREAVKSSFNDHNIVIPNFPDFDP